MNVCTKCGETIYIGPRGCWCIRQARRERELEEIRKASAKAFEDIQNKPELMERLREWIEKIES